jgi:pyruvate,water dikinase
MSYVFPLDGCEPHVAAVVGGKAVGLGRLMREGLRVPPGFAVGTHAYREFVTDTGLDRAIHGLLEDAGSVDEQAEVARRIRSLFDEHEAGSALREQLARAYEGLGADLPVAVRSSAITEDAAQASFAGEHDTFLWVVGDEAVGRAVLCCWASLFSRRALAYFGRVGLRPGESAMGVVVQAMVAAEAAGAMMTLDPVTGDRSQITIEGAYGLGEAVVAGEVNPDRYAVDKVTLEIRSRTVGMKHVAYRFDPALGEVRLDEVPPEEQPLPCLSDDEIVEIATLGKRVERSLGRAQDVEWAIDGSREVHLLQTRPETVWSQKHAPVPTGVRP